MLPIIKLSQAWLEEIGWSHAEAADVFDMDLATAVAAAADDKCPQCGRHPAEHMISVFVPDPSSATPEHVFGRAHVLCLCKTMYWYEAVHTVEVEQAVGSADVRSARTTTKTPGTGAVEIKGQDAIAPVISETATSEMPPGRGFIGQPMGYYRWYTPHSSAYFTPIRSAPDAGADNAKPNQ